ncbi:Sugar kinase of the NBD/HSP70 family, may contain an N-terminal HTH domain [Fictibacillus solisalsi]|uniref:Sugar kinase of the NBD/HSP70 family, may contain an N-terminal HTH domain n=1 Tax=Fictibacillus solisalsi TaxID=459525 RepID=A0A1H0BDB2_9BACL|nr:ROK family protein [Fictibacillus solisalsi]SDN43664.1 Sugar kinase of the NBD/HSP70 family, may contain an N-terminal HTH domain [Fictibacillus solisalsi]
MKSYLPNDIKDENRKIIFDILLHHPELAKVEITEKTAMSFVTVSKIVNYFTEIGILKETGESRDGMGGLGRKRTVYKFNENSYVTIGLEIMGQAVTALLVNLKNQVIASRAFHTDLPFYHEAFDRIFNEIVEVMEEEAKKTSSVVLGIGIGVAGAINTRSKTIRMKTAEDQEEDFHFGEIVERLKDNVSYPILLENDVNASTVAEFRSLEASDEMPDDLIHISFGEGIGAGLILNKKLHRGFNSRAGELEYLCFDEDFKKTPASVGWLEGKLGLSAIVKKFDLSNPQESKACQEYLAKKIALVVTNIISVLDVDRIIISGKTMALFSEGLLPRIREYVGHYMDWDPTISFSAAEHMSALGAGILLLQREMGKVISAEKAVGGEKHA